MKMIQSKETTESNNKNDINDIKSENIEIDNKTVCKNSFLSKSGEHNFTSVNVSTKAEETDSDDEPLLKKFEKEIKNSEEKEKGKEKEKEKHKEKENEKEKEKEKKKEKENGEEKKKKKGSGYDDSQINNNLNERKQEIISSDDECLLDLVKREHAKEMRGRPSSDHSMNTSSIDSDAPILSKCKKNLFKKKEKEFLVNSTDNANNSSLNNILHTSNVSNDNIKTKHMETVTSKKSGSNSYSIMCENPPSKEEKTEKGDKSSSNNNNNNNNNINKNKSKVQKSIKKTPKKTPNKTPRKKNTTNSSNVNNDNKNNNSSTRGKRKTTAKTTKTKKTERSIKKRKKTTKRKRTKRKTKPKAKSKTKKDTTRKTTTAKKTKGRTKGTRKTTKSSKSKDANYNNLENDSILIGNFDPHNRSNKEKLVAQLLIRWWYILPEWPPADYNYEEELRKRKLKLVPLEAYENEEDIDENGFRKVYQISAFPGIFRDAMGTAYDLRDKDTCPSFNKFMKKSDLELLDLICQAIKNQLKCLKNSVYDESANEKRLEKELKDVEAKLNKLIKKGKSADKGNEVKTEVKTDVKAEVKAEVNTEVKIGTKTEEQIAT